MAGPKMKTDVPYMAMRGAQWRFGGVGRLSMDAPATAGKLFSRE